MLLLDTHAWLWTVEGNARRVGRKALRLIAQAEAQGAARVSAASVFEIVALHAAGRVVLAQPPEQWIETSLERSGLRVAEVNREVAIDAGFIPRTALPDPLDRLLVATARQIDATLLSADAAILSYATRAASVRVHDLSR